MGSVIFWGSTILYQYLPHFSYYQYNWGLPIFTTWLFLTRTVDWCPNKIGDGQSKFPPSSEGDRYPKNIRRDHRTIQSRWAEFTEISGHFGRDMKSVVIHKFHSIPLHYITLHIYIYIYTVYDTVYKYKLKKKNWESNVAVEQSLQRDRCFLWEK